MRTIAFVFLVALMSGCAVNSGVVPTGSDSYFLSRQGAAVYGMGNLKAEAYGEAGQFCNLRGLVPKVSRESESKPPYILGNYPKFDIEFSCVTKESRPPLSSFFK